MSLIPPPEDASPSVQATAPEERPRRSRLKKVLLWIGGVLLFLVLVLGGAVWWVTSTQPGARWAFERLGGLMKGGLTVGQVTGPLKGPLTVTDLTWKSESLEVHIKTATLKWHLTRLLKKQLDIESLTADGVIVTPIPAKEKKDQPLSDIHLPINFIVRDAYVTHVEITAGVPANPRHIDSIRLATTSAGETVRIQTLAVRGPDFNLDVTGDVTPIGDYPVDLKVAWSSERANTVPFGGHGVLTGTLEKLKVVHDVERPFTAHVDSLLTTPLRTIGFEGTVDFADLKLKDLNKEWPEVTLGGKASAKGAEPERFTAEGVLTTKTAMMQVGQADAAFRLERDHDVWKFERLDVTMPGRPARIGASGTVTLAKDKAHPDQTAIKMALKASWKDVRWPLAGAPTIESPAGKADVSGTLDAYDLDLDADLRGPSIPPGHWTLKGAGTKESMKIASAMGLIFGGRISGSGDVSWAPETRWRLALKGEDVNPATKVKDWDGRISFTASTEGKMTKAGPVASVEIPDLHGTLRKQPLAAQASLRIDGDEYLIRKLDVTSGSAHASASGRAGRVWGLDWQVTAPNIGNLVAGYSGAVDAKGHLEGPQSTPHVTATMTGASLATATEKIAKLTANADLDLRPRGRIHIDAAATGIQAGKRVVDAVNLVANGTREAHEATLTVVAPNDDKQEKLDLAVRGGLDAKMAWRGQVTRLDLVSPEVGTWHLAAPAQLVAGKDVNALHGFCWASGGARLCVDADSKKAGAGTEWSANATLAALPLDMFKPFLPPDVEIAGTVDGRIKANANAAGTLIADVDVKPSPGTLQYPVSVGQKGSVAYHDVFLTARADATGLSMRAGAILENVGTLAAEFVLPEYNARGMPAETQKLRGRIRMDVSDLAFVQGFYQGVEHVKGALHADLTIGGTRGTPTGSGAIKLENAEADLPDYALQLRDINAAVLASGSDRVTVEGRVRSGGGTITLAGSSPLQPTEAAPAKLHIEGTNFVARDSEEMHVLVSPKIDVTIYGKRVKAEGEVVVPQARIDMKKKFAQVELSKDVVIHGAGDEQPTKSPWEIHTRVRLVLVEAGNDPRGGVRFSGSGMKARFQGSLLAIDEPGKPTIATGQLEAVDGTYKAYGQDLTLERARIYYGGGSLSNPGIDLKAYRRAKDGTIAGVIVKGTLDAPETTVYSEPAMSQADALSYILLGHPLGSSTQQEGSLVANAAASLGLKGGNILAKKIAGKLGLEEAKIETEGSYKEAALVVGKFLSPKFYVQYGIGLFSGASTLRISYILNKKWTVRAETGAVENGADILYTIEK